MDKFNRPLVWILDDDWDDYEEEINVLSEIDAEIITTRSDKYNESHGELLPKVDALVPNVTFPVKINKDIIGKLKNCKIISVPGIGVDNVDLDSASEAGIIVTNVPGYCKEEVSDHALALMLALIRHLCKLNFEVRRGVWGGEAYDASTKKIADYVVGILGFGHIGQTLCKKVLSLGMKVLVYDPVVSQSVIKGCGAEGGSLEEVLMSCDILSLHIPLNKSTRHLITGEKLDLMKKGAYLVNTCRGGVIEESALIRALDSGWLAGAGLDVFEEEPVSQDNPLLKMENVILTPHCSYLGSINMLKRLTAVNIVKYYKGEQLPVVNKI